MRRICGGCDPSIVNDWKHSKPRPRSSATARYVFAPSRRDCMPSPTWTASTKNACAKKRGTERLRSRRWGRTTSAGGPGTVCYSDLLRHRLTRCAAAWNGWRRRSTPREVRSERRQRGSLAAGRKGTNSVAVVLAVFVRFAGATSLVRLPDLVLSKNLIGRKGSLSAEGFDSDPADCVADDVWMRRVDRRSSREQGIMSGPDHPRRGSVAPWSFGWLGNVVNQLPCHRRSAGSTRLFGSCSAHA